MMNFGPNQVLVNKSTLRNEQMQHLCALTLRMIIFIVIPHYVLVGFCNYVYRPRLAQFILNFKTAKIEEMLQARSSNFNMNFF